MNVVDSSGWLEYFANGKNADYFASAIQDTEALIVSTINLYEVFKRILQQRDENAAFQAIALMQQGQIADVTPTISLNAAKNSIDLKLPMADSIIYTTAQIYNATLWTQDSDFENMDGVNFIEKKK
ncbi:MAG: type II toxin-antitoxin system VapC family toxin [Gemmatimonadetes bacterium]|jgi:toxin FitB|nr:type II toxin-antitoxin system VapC family toxin [Gemmatimonadota bacterium]MBT7914957.1 type II toxin-antitoxin system VapC family toxin [Candidatus Bathyarchaeota archaeon]